jgi:Na+/phosphate symporter
MKIDKHADNVVEGFKRSLTKEQRAALGDEAFEELQILIEAAIGDTVSKALHDVAKELEKMAKVTRKRASSIDRLEE